MAFADYGTVLIGYANTFIALFILVYAYLFLQKTKKHRDRRPWDFLFIASFLFLLFQIFTILVISGVTTVSTIDLYLVGNVMAFLYSGAVLLAFISQHDLILRSQLILISKKDEVVEKDMEIKIGLPEQKSEKKEKKSDPKNLELV